MAINQILLTFIPEFKIGILNAWIGTFSIMILPYIFRILWGPRREGHERELESYNNKEGKIVDYTMAVYYLTVLYSIVLSLKTGTSAFILGTILFFFAFAGLVLAYFSFYATPKGQLVTTGMFRYSRNPFYLCTSLAFLGIGIASLSWLLLLLTVIFIVLQHRVVLAEERICEANFGKKYLDYKDKVPRYILFF